MLGIGTSEVLVLALVVFVVLVVAAVLMRWRRRP